MECDQVLSNELIIFLDYSQVCTSFAAVRLCYKNYTHSGGASKNILPSLQRYEIRYDTIKFAKYLSDRHVLDAIRGRGTTYCFKKKIRKFSRCHRRRRCPYPLHSLFLYSYFFFFFFFFFFLSLFFS